MKTKFKIALTTLILIALAALLGIYLSTQNIPVLEPKGLIGLKQRQLMLIACLLMMLVVIPVFVMTFLFAVKYRDGNKSKYTPDWEHSTLAETIWWGVPFLMIVVLAGFTWKSSHELSPFKPIDSKVKPITIQVVALNWKWLFIYPDYDIATINYIKFPEKTPINFLITADAPMNSFWIPQLGGQVYAMPSMCSKLHLIANETGVFRGSSANLSGEGFAGMVFEATSTSQSDFNEWVQSVKRTNHSINISKYNELVPPSQNVPPQDFRLSDVKLFEYILDKYRSKPRESAWNFSEN